MDRAPGVLAGMLTGDEEGQKGLWDPAALPQYPSSVGPLPCVPKDPVSPGAWYTRQTVVSEALTRPLHFPSQGGHVAVSQFPPLPEPQSPYQGMSSPGALCVPRLSHAS